MFIASLFIIARNWKHPRCPSTKKKKKMDTENVVHLHNVKSAIKNNNIMKFAGK
jgi:hypothetical protein